MENQFFFIVSNGVDYKKNACISLRNKKDELFTKKRFQQGPKK